jgi:hypothetical protein
MLNLSWQWWPSMVIVRRGRERMVVGFKNYLCNHSLSIATNVASSNPAHGEVYWIQHDDEFASDLRYICCLLQVGGFLRFPSQIKLTATKVSLNTSSIWGQLSYYLRWCYRKSVLRMRNRKLRNIRPSGAFSPEVTSE